MSIETALRPNAKGAALQPRPRRTLLVVVTAVAMLSTSACGDAGNAPASPDGALPRRAHPASATLVDRGPGRGEVVPASTPAPPMPGDRVERAHRPRVDERPAP